MDNIAPNYSDTKLYLQCFKEEGKIKRYKFLWTINNFKEIVLNKEYVCHCIFIGGEYHYLRIKRITYGNKAVGSNTRLDVNLSLDISPYSVDTEFKLKNCSSSYYDFQELPFSAPNGQLEIICEMTLYQNYGVFPEVFIPLLETEQSLEVCKHIDEMFTSGILTDLKISVGEKIFNVHKAVLVSRSEVFATMLETNMKEKAENEIVIRDSESENFGEFLHYVYSNKLNLSNMKSALELYRLSEKYDLPDLKLDTSVFLARNLNAENVIQIQKLADLHEDSKLKEATMDYMFRCLPEVMKSGDWFSFRSSTEDVDYLFSILGKFVYENKIYEDYRPLAKK